MSSSSSPLRLALIGAGTFARDAHLPSLLRHPDRFKIVAVYSRTQATAEALTAILPQPVQTYTELEPLLARTDIEAVDILLPIVPLPAAVRQAWAAGKHVLSEKPIAPTVTTGRALLAEYANYPKQVWMVGENWRYEAAFLQAADLIRQEAIGDPLTVHWTIYTPITPTSKYYHTTWRRDGSFPGGFLLDGGIHHLATLRLILGEIVQVSATAKQNSPDLPPLDTMAATLQFANGALGTYLTTFATGAPWPPALYIGGSQGSLRVQRKEIELTRGGSTERIECAGFDGVEKELLAFADAMQLGTPHRNTPQEALRDLAVVEALLRSAEISQPVSPEPV